MPSHIYYIPILADPAAPPILCLCLGPWGSRWWSWCSPPSRRGWSCQVCLEFLVHSVSWGAGRRCTWLMFYNSFTNEGIFWKLMKKKLATSNNAASTRTLLMLTRKPLFTTDHINFTATTRSNRSTFLLTPYYRNWTSNTQMRIKIKLL